MDDNSRTALAPTPSSFVLQQGPDQVEIDQLESIDIDQNKKAANQSPMPAINFTMVGEVKYQGATKLAQPSFGVLPPIQSG